MRWCCLLFWVIFLLGHSQASPVPATPTPSTVATINNTEYVDFPRWLASRGTSLSWARTKEVFYATSKSTTLSFKIDSRRMEMNGLALWLSHAASHKNGTLLISRLDVTTLFTPLLFPTRNATFGRGTIKTVALDAGHGGRDPGNQEGVHQEKYHTLLLAREVRKRLMSNGLKVVMVRNSDRYVDLKERPMIAKRGGADLFISLHFNGTSGNGNGTRGAEVFCLTPAGATSTNVRGDVGSLNALPGNRYNDLNVLLASHVQRALVKQAGLEDRGVRRARWAVLRDTSMPGILVEAGFMSDPAEARKIYSDAHRKLLAQTITDGILAYKRTVERKG